MTEPAARRAVVTGASGGIGAAIAMRLAQDGISLVLVGQQEGRLRELVQRLGPSVDAEVVVADLTKLNTSPLPAILSSDDRPVDVLVNCAGYTVVGAFHDVDLAATMSMIHVNVLALTELCHIAGRAMARRGGGTIVNISSKAAFGSRAGAACYGASKAFVNVFSRAIAAELAPSGVKVVCVCPGGTSTGFFSRAGMDAESFDRSDWQTAEQVADVAIAAMAGADVLTITSPAIADAVRRWADDEWAEVSVREPQAM